MEKEAFPKERCFMSLRRIEITKSDQCGNDFFGNFLLEIFSGTFFMSLLVRH